MRLSPLLSIVALIAMLSQTSCFGTWEAREYLSTLAWADDDSAIAVVIFRYEAKPALHPLAGAPDQRKMRHQLYVQQPNGNGRVAITGEIDGQNAAELYYVKSRGYFVLSGVDPNGRWFHRITPNGARQEIARVTNSSCEGRHFDVVPSPDGLHLAVLKTAPGCTATSTGPASPTGTPGQTSENISVVFLNASTLAEVQSQTVTIPAWGVEWTWRPEGDFVVAASGTAWSLAVGRAPQATNVPDCFWPKTTSGLFSSTGLHIYPDGMDAAFGGSAPDAAFGCQ